MLTPCSITQLINLKYAKNKHSIKFQQFFFKVTLASSFPIMKIFGKNQKEKNYLIFALGFVESLCLIQSKFRSCPDKEKIPTRQACHCLSDPLAQSLGEKVEPVPRRPIGIARTTDPTFTSLRVEATSLLRL